MKDPTSPVCQTISALLAAVGDKWTVLVVRRWPAAEAIQ